MAKCLGTRTTEDIRYHLTTLDEEDILYGLEKHADPKFWETNRGQTAYLRKWGSILRREARKRGLL